MREDDIEHEALPGSHDLYAGGDRGVGSVDRDGVLHSISNSGHVTEQSPAFGADPGSRPPRQPA